MWFCLYIEGYVLLSSSLGRSVFFQYIKDILLFFDVTVSEEETRLTWIAALYAICHCPQVYFETFSHSRCVVEKLLWLALASLSLPCSGLSEIQFDTHFFISSNWGKVQPLFLQILVLVLSWKISLSFIKAKFHNRLLVLHFRPFFKDVFRISLFRLDSFYLSLR